MKKKIIIICSISVVLVAAIVTGVLFLLNVNKNTDTDQKDETFMVTFDSNGGSNVNSIKVVCGKELSLPESPTKDGYSFISWVDKNETPIYDGALLSCEDITLKANWQKEETKEENNATTQNNNKEVKKTYKCPPDYTLSGTKCTITKSVTKYCTGSNDILIGDYCYYSRRDVSRCNYEGVYAYSNVDHQNRCFYDVTTDYMKESSCIASGNYWINGLCYTRKEAAANVCESTWHFVDAHQIPGYGTTPGIVDGCYQRKSAQIKCDEGYELTDNSCAKTINATLE